MAATKPDREHDVDWQAVHGHQAQIQCLVGPWVVEPVVRVDPQPVINMSQ